MKFSSIKNSGLDVFSSQSFKKNEFITCYLSEVDENPSDETYTIKKINGIPVKSAYGLLEDYWFGHQIQHGSGNKANNQWGVCPTPTPIKLHWKGEHADPNSFSPRWINPQDKGCVVRTLAFMVYSDNSDAVYLLLANAGREQEGYSS